MDSRSTSLTVKLLFGSYGLVGTPTFSTRTKAHRMVGYSAVIYPVNTFENGDFKLGCESVRLD